MDSPPPKALASYVVLVCAAGLAAFGVGVWHGSSELTSRLPELAVLTPLVVLGELIPIRVPRGDNLREVRTSITFVFALLLMAGPAAAPALRRGASRRSASGRERRGTGRCAGTRAPRRG